MGQDQSQFAERRETQRQTRSTAEPTSRQSYSAEDLFHRSPLSAPPYKAHHDIESRDPLNAAKLPRPPSAAPPTHRPSLPSSLSGNPFGLCRKSSQVNLASSLARDFQTPPTPTPLIDGLPVPVKRCQTKKASLARKLSRKAGDRIGAVVDGVSDKRSESALEAKFQRLETIVTEAEERARVKAGLRGYGREGQLSESGEWGVRRDAQNPNLPSSFGSSTSSGPSVATPNPSRHNLPLPYPLGSITSPGNIPTGFVIPRQITGRLGSSCSSRSIRSSHSLSPGKIRSKAEREWRARVAAISASAKSSRGPSVNPNTLASRAHSRSNTPVIGVSAGPVPPRRQRPFPLTDSTSSSDHSHFTPIIGTSSSGHNSISPSNTSPSIPTPPHLLPYDPASPSANSFISTNSFETLGRYAHLRPAPSPSSSNSQSVAGLGSPRSPRYLSPEASPLHGKFRTRKVSVPLSVSTTHSDRPGSERADTRPFSLAASTFFSPSRLAVAADEGSAGASMIVTELGVLGKNFGDGSEASALSLLDTASSCSNLGLERRKSNCTQISTTTTSGSGSEAIVVSLGAAVKESQGRQWAFPVKQHEARSTIAATTPSTPVTTVRSSTSAFPTTSAPPPAVSDSSAPTTPIAPIRGSTSILRTPTYRDRSDDAGMETPKSKARKERIASLPLIQTAPAVSMSRVVKVVQEIPVSPAVEIWLSDEATRHSLTAFMLGQSTPSSSDQSVPSHFLAAATDPSKLLSVPVTDTPLKSARSGSSSLELPPRTPSTPYSPMTAYILSAPSIDLSFPVHDDLPSPALLYPNGHLEGRSRIGGKEVHPFANLVDAPSPARLPITDPIRRDESKRWYPVEKEKQYRLATPSFEPLKLCLKGRAGTTQRLSATTAPQQQPTILVPAANQQSAAGVRKADQERSNVRLTRECSTRPAAVFRPRTPNGLHPPRAVILGSENAQAKSRRANLCPGMDNGVRPPKSGMDSSMAAGYQ